MQECSDLRREILQLTSVNMNYCLYTPTILIHIGFKRHSQGGVTETICRARECEIIFD
jgi:hypothetical protein